jgi:hypothetical protein
MWLSLRRALNSDVDEIVFLTRSRRLLSVCLSVSLYIVAGFPVILPNSDFSTLHHARVNGSNAIWVLGSVASSAHF